MKKLSILIVPLCLLGCTDSKQKEETKKAELGEFVYIDRSECLHTNKNCMNLLDLSDEGTNKNYQVKFVETKKLYPAEFNSICSYCVSDETFKELRKVIRQNGYTYENEEVDSVAAY